VTPLAKAVRGELAHSAATRRTRRS
jgi:hypothetical protein